MNIFEKPKDLEIKLIKGFYDEDLSNLILKNITENEKIDFESRDIRLFGKVYKQPRLISWHGDKEATYTYSKEQFKPKPWTKSLMKIKDDLNEKLNADFNSVLLNLYRNGQDSMGLHSDDEKELRSEPLIASLSLGETRCLRFVHKTKKESFNLELSNGDLLVMSGKTQELYKHELPKSKKILGRRLNLTFRTVFS